MTARQLARYVLLGSLGFNIGLVLSSILRGKVEPAAVQLILVTLLAAWLAIAPKIDAWLDARLAEAAANQRCAELACAELDRLHARGELRVGVTVQGKASERMH
jgi:hypothetical protein